MIRIAFLCAALAACGASARDGGGGADGNGSGSGSGSGTSDSYLVYAHSDTILYTIDLSSHALVTVGSFMAPNPITDLAVAPDGTLYAISETALYTASASDAHVTNVGSLSTCGTKGVALTTTADGRLWMGDFNGSICQIDISGATPVVKPPIKMSNNMALAGDIVGVGNGTVFGTAYKIGDAQSQTNNALVKIDVATGQVTTIGSSGYPKLFGASFQQDKVFAFTHDGTGRVVTIDPTTGIGTMFATFMDPQTNTGISFAGAAVNSLVTIE